MIHSLQYPPNNKSVHIRGCGAWMQGEVLGNLRHGAGTFTLASGAVYAGDWRYDALEGRGKASMPDGQTYEGQWRGGKAKGCAAIPAHRPARGGPAAEQRKQAAC